MICIPKVNVSVHNGTLIDNLFTNIQFTANPSKAGVLLDKLSDHQPYFMIFNIKRVKEKSPQYVQINNINDTSIANIIQHLTEVDIFRITVARLRRPCHVG